MPTSKRSGKIAGLLVILLLIILIPTWALGHWLSASNPASSGATATGVTQGGATQGIDVTSIANEDSSSNSQREEITNGVDDANADLVDAQEIRGDAGMPEHAAAPAGVVQGDSELSATINDLKEQLAAVSAQRDRLKTQAAKSAQLQEQSTKQEAVWKQQRQDFITRIQQQEQKLAALQKQVKTRPAMPNPDQAATASAVALPANASSNAQQINSPIISPSRKRGWKAVTGKVVEAEFMGLEGDIVLLQAKGKVFRVPLSKLAEEDRVIANQLNQ